MLISSFLTCKNSLDLALCMRGWLLKMLIGTFFQHLFAIKPLDEFDCEIVIFDYFSLKIGKYLILIIEKYFFFFQRGGTYFFQLNR